MASAVKATRNDTTWPTNHPQPRTAGAGFMGKIPFLNNNPNPNSNSNSRKQFPHQNGDDFANPAASDDAASFSHRRPSDSADVGASFSQYVSFNISGYSRSEIRTLKSRLMVELDRVRFLSSQIESGEFWKVSSNPKKRPTPISQLNKDSKRFASSSNGNGNGKQQQSPLYTASAQVMKLCRNVLTKLMKQKSGYVFNSPVDVVGFGLHDYHQIIKHPMDLGTIKMNLAKNLYPTPEEFASDVRLTFNNALRYNPKGHEVHVLAEQYLARFEQMFTSVYHKFQMEKLRHQQQQQPRQQKPENWTRDEALAVVDEVQGSSWIKQSSPEVPKKTIPSKRPELVEPPRSEPPPRVTPPPASTPAPAPVPAPALAQPLVPASEMVASVPVKGPVGRAPSGKLPKPKAKDPNKRPMSMEEKHKLGAGLQSLPDEKMAQVIQIIRKRNGHLTQDGDEIELDIEAVDTETLWELDRFVVNYKKMVSKIKRQALMGNPNNNVGYHNTANQAGVSERMTETGKAKKCGGDVGEEDVDIGDEMPVNNFPPLEIEKDDDRHQGGASSSSSSSSSSGSDSSSSSDTDSGSSSGSDSDVDDAQSRDNESKNIHL